MCGHYTKQSCHFFKYVDGTPQFCGTDPASPASIPLRVLAAWHLLSLLVGPAFGGLHALPEACSCGPL